MMRLHAILGLVTALSVPLSVAAQPKAAKPEPTFHIPYKLTDTAHVLVRVKINGQGPFNYIIDTGSPFTFVSTQVAKKLKIAAKDRVKVLVQFDIEGGISHQKATVLVHTPFQLEGMNAMNFAGVELHGIIGYDLLAQYKMEFDFSRHKMKWTRLKFVPPPPKMLKVKGGAPGGMSMIGGMMKFMSWIVGKKVSPQQVPAGYLGVELAEKNNQVAITSIYPDSPAAKAGLKEGDYLVALDGNKVASIAAARKQAQALQPGQSVEISIRRGERTLQKTITAGKGL